MDVEELIDQLAGVKDKKRKVVISRVGNSPFATLHIDEIEYTNYDSGPIQVKAKRI